MPACSMPPRPCSQLAEVRHAALDCSWHCGETFDSAHAAWHVKVVWAQVEREKNMHQRFAQLLAHIAGVVQLRVGGLSHQL
jgi:hypothetical protein